MRRRTPPGVRRSCSSSIQQRMHFRSYSTSSLRGGCRARHYCCWRTASRRHQPLSCTRKHHKAPPRDLVCDVASRPECVYYTANDLSRSFFSDAGNAIGVKRVGSNVCFRTSASSFRCAPLYVHDQRQRHRRSASFARPRSVYPPSVASLFVARTTTGASILNGAPGRN